MDARLGTAILAGKTVAALSRRLGAGGGTALPGLVAQAIAPTLLRQLTAQLPRGAVAVTGTNGKTTTARLIAHILRCAGFKAIHNHAGANLLRGIAAALVEASGLNGRPHGDIGVFEVDEAILPALLQQAHPQIIVFTNLFRDQLDRYGEVDHVLSLWQSATGNLPPDSTLILNADDPRVASLALVSPATIIYYGLEEEARATEPSHLADARACLRCGEPLRYEAHYYGHLGRYCCLACGWKRPEPTFTAAHISLSGGGSVFRLAAMDAAWDVTIGLPGRYNIYNVLAAVATCRALGLDWAPIQAGLASFAGAFGRTERIPYDGRALFLALVKNPVGFQETLSTIANDLQGATLLIVINDRLADGTDISWLWDVDLETTCQKARLVVTSGTRAEDMALRLKYAGLDPQRIVLQPNLSAALKEALERTAPGETLYILPTYTALLEVRALIQRLTPITPFWEE